MHWLFHDLFGMRSFLVVIISVFLLLEMNSLVTGTGTNNNDGDITQAELPESTSTWQRFSRNLRSFSLTRSTSRNSKISESSSSDSDENPVCPPGTKSIKKLSRGFSRTFTKLKSMSDDTTQFVTKGLARITSRVGSFRGYRGIHSKQSSFSEDSLFDSPPRNFPILMSSPDVFSNSSDISLTPQNTPPKPSRKTRSPSKSPPRKSPKSSPKSSSVHSPPSPRNFFSSPSEEEIPIPWCLASSQSAHAYSPVTEHMTSPPTSRLSSSGSRLQFPPASSNSHPRLPPPLSKSHVASSPPQKTLSDNIPRRTTSSKSPRETEHSPSSRYALQPPRDPQPSPRRSPPKQSKQAPRRHLSLVKWSRETPQEPKNKVQDLKQELKDTLPFNPPNKPLKLPSKRHPYFPPNQNPPAPPNSPIHPSANVKNTPQLDRINEGRRPIPKMDQAWFNPDQRAFDQINRQLMDLFTRQEVPDKYAFLATLQYYFDLRCNTLSEGDQKASKQFLEEYCLRETPGDEISLTDDAAMIRNCERACTESWGYVYYVPPKVLGPPGLRFLRSQTSLEFFACGKLIPITDGDISKIQKPTITPSGKIDYRCDCITNKKFNNILDELKINVNEFTDLKIRKGHQETLVWLNLKLKSTNVQHVQLVTIVEYEEQLRNLFREKKVPSINEDLSQDYKMKRSRAIGGESESRADEEYWKGMQFYRG